MSAAAELFIRVAGDITDIKPKLAQVAAEADKMADGVKKASTGAASGLDRVRDAAVGVGKSFVANLAANLATDALQSVTRATIDAGKASLQLAGELEQSKVAFTTMLGSAAKADRHLKDLAQFAANTPFELRGLQDSAKKLLAFGFEAKNIIPIMTGVGNAVAGLGGGKDMLDGITMALGQMAAKGKVSAEEMGQLAERGVPAWDMLAKTIGKSVPEAMKMAEQGAIPAGKAIEALVNGMNERFPKMMEAQSKTLLGAWSNLQDGISGTLTQIGKKIEETFNLTEVVRVAAAGMSALAKSIENDDLAGIFTAIKAAALGFSVAVTTMVAPAVVRAIETQMIPAIRLLAASWAPAVAAAAPYIALAAAVAFAAVPIINQWDTLKVELSVFWAELRADAARSWNEVRTAFSNMFNAGMSVVKGLASWFASLFGGLARHAQTAFNALPESVRGPLKNMGDAFAGFVQNVHGDVAHLPGMMSTAIKPMVSMARGAGELARKNLAVSWGGIGDSIRSVMGNVNQALAGTTLEVGKLHLNFGKAGDAAKKAGGHAKKAADEAKKAMAAAARAAHEHAVAIERGGKALVAFNDRVSVFAGLGRDVREVQEQSHQLGQRFDHNAALADSYREAIEKLKHMGFRETSTIVKGLTAQMEKFADASKKGTKPIAEAYKIFDDATDKIEETRLKAKLLGEEFDGGKVSTDQYASAIRSMIDQGVRPGNPALDEAIAKYNALKGATDRGALSLGGIRDAARGAFSEMGTLGGNLKTIAESLGAPFLGPLGEGIGKVSGLGTAFISASESVQKLIPVIGQVGSWFQTTGVEALRGFGATIQTVVIPELGKMAFAAWGALGPFGQIAVVVGGAIMAAQLLRENWGKVTEFLAGAWQRVADGAKAAFEGLAGVVTGIWDGITNTIKGAINFFTAAVNLLIRGVNSFQIKVPDWVPNIGGRGWGGFGIPEIPYLATGGLVTSPTLAMVGEGRHKEAVLPLNDAVYGRLGRGIAENGGGGGTTVHITINAGSRDVGELIVRELKKAGIRVG